MDDAQGVCILHRLAFAYQIPSTRQTLSELSELDASDDRGEHFWPETHPKDGIPEPNTSLVECLFFAFRFIRIDRIGHYS